MTNTQLFYIVIQSLGSRNPRIDPTVRLLSIMVQEKITRLLRQATEANSNHQYWSALEGYTDILTLIEPQTGAASHKNLRLTALRERGRLLGLVGEQEAALSAYVQYHREAGDEARQIDALIKLGDQTRGIGRYTQSIRHYNEALALAEKREDTTAHGRVLVGIGLLKLVRGRHEEAISYLSDASALFEQSGAAAQQIRTLNRIGVAYAYSGQMDRAIATFTNALNLSRKINQQDTAVAALNNLGECHQSLYDFQQALVFHQEGLRLAEEAQLRIIEADICRNLGLDLCQLRRFDEGYAFLLRALTISQETKHPDNLAHTHYALALTEFERNNWEGALHFAHQLKEMATQNDSRNLLALAYHALGLYYQKKQDLLTAEQHWQHTLFLAHEANNRTLLWKTHAALAEIASTSDLARVHRRIAVEVIKQIADPIADETLRNKFLTAPPVMAIMNSQ